MSLFDPKNRTRSPKHEQLYAAYELAFTMADLAAALLFVIGSLFFFSDETQLLGTWMFLIGSVFFMLKPTIRLLRELHYWRLGDVDTLAQRARE